MDLIGQIALYILNEKLKNKVDICSFDSMAEDAVLDSVDFIYSDEDKATNEFVNKLIEPAINALANNIIHEAKKGKIAFGKLEISGEQVYEGEVNNVRLRYSSGFGYKLGHPRIIARFDVLYNT